MRPVVIVPDGVGVRNFVLGKFLRCLPAQTEAHVFHSIPEEMLPRVAGAINGRAQWHKLKRFHPDKITDLLQGSLARCEASEMSGTDGRSSARGSHGSVCQP